MKTHFEQYVERQCRNIQEMRYVVRYNNAIPCYALRALNIPPPHLFFISLNKGFSVLFLGLFLVRLGKVKVKFAP